MEKENNYILGIIGAFVGGLIASLPWIICYVYLDMLWSLLALFIAMGALKGYQILGGKEDKKLPLIIAIISIVVITIVTLIVIPLLLLAKEGLASIPNLKLLYQISDFKTAIMKDYIFSLLFTILGISGVITNIKNQIDQNVSKVKLSNIEANKEIEELKGVFIKNNALSKENAIDKQIIIDEVDNINLFNTLTMQQIIRKYKGKYYFSEKAENSLLYRFLLLYGKIMIIIIVITMVATLFISLI